MTELYTLLLLFLAWLVAAALCAWKKSSKTGVHDSGDVEYQFFTNGSGQETVLNNSGKIQKRRGITYDPHQDEHKQMTGEVESYFDA